ncbi:MAG TPA: prenyltransferase/squalene oxidase repeat-containing protein [Acidobacteriota bacterium]|jgi:prenyltransferase beta subunit
MLQVARLAPQLLSDSRDLVVDFIRGQLNDDGGFKDRSGKSDLYYTVFGLEALIALQADLPVPVQNYVCSFGSGDSLDFVHLTCLARCYACLPGTSPEPWIRQAILNRVEGRRSLDGGYHEVSGSQHGTVYGCFLAKGAYQDLGSELPNEGGVLHCLESSKTADGAFSNQPRASIGTTPATAAAVTLLRTLGKPVEPSVGTWLLDRCYREGGFFAVPGAPMPDLLSTATALHALAGMQVPLEGLTEACLNFVDSLWSSKGAFYGNWADDALDCEYTYYGLLALGHLSLW